MTHAEVVTYLGYLVSAWTMGFTGGYYITKFRDAANAAT